MNFRAVQADLIKALNTADKAVSSKTTIPALKGLLLEVKNNKLFITASNIDMTIVSSVDVQSEEDGSLIVNAKLFEEIVRKMPSSVIKFSESNNKLLISCIDSEFNIVTMSADEYPKTGFIESENKITISADVFKKLIKGTCFAASPDEKHGILTGCLIKFSDGYIESAALDRFRLAVMKTPACVSESRQIIVSAKYLTEINKILNEFDFNEISLVSDNKRLEILYGNTVVLIRLLEGEFINYNSIIPSDYKTKIIFNVSEMKNAIERASLLSSDGKTSLIKLDIKENSIEITARSEDGNVKETVAAEVTGQDITIGFNYKYITDVLRIVNEDEIAFEITSAVSACVFRPVSGDFYTYLVLPVRIGL